MIPRTNLPKFIHFKTALSLDLDVTTDLTLRKALKTTVLNSAHVGCPVFTERAWILSNRLPACGPTALTAEDSGPNWKPPSLCTEVGPADKTACHLFIPSIIKRTVCKNGAYLQAGS
jgi:hypothetical protein